MRIEIKEKKYVMKNSRLYKAECKRDKETGEWRKLHNEELHDSQSSQFCGLQNREK
jgi:hypothetical protein